MFSSYKLYVLQIIVVLSLVNSLITRMRVRARVCDYNSVVVYVFILNS